MTKPDLSPDRAAANRIRSLLKTIDRSMRVSMTSHHRLTPSTVDTASILGMKAVGIAERYPNADAVQRQVRKLEELLGQHGIVDSE